LDLLKRKKKEGDKLDANRTTKRQEKQEQQTIGGYNYIRCLFVYAIRSHKVSTMISFSSLVRINGNGNRRP
jgi:hypothetical protein